MPDSSFLPAGTILENNYRIIKGLGQGGFARTYLAINLRRFNENCVLKEFAPQIADSQVGKATELFEREASIMYKLEHDQIPKFREQFKARTSAGESLFIVQDYIEGDTYWQLLQNRGRLFSEVEIVQFFQQILPVLDYIHQMGVVHRDISPDNIICRKSDSLPVLIDFGAVREAAAKYSHVTGTVIGKLGFAPDEQMRRGQVSPASDLYALAATALVLLTGMEPYQLYNTRTATWDWESHLKINADLAKVLNKMLAYKAKDRYQSATEILVALPKSKKLSRKSALLSGMAPAPDLLSRLRTLVVSPKAASRPTTPVSTSVTNVAEWQKPAIAVGKTVTSLFLSIWAVTAGINWLQANDPLKNLSKDFSKSFDPMKSIGAALPKSFDPMKSINDALPKSFDPMKSINGVLPKSFDPMKSVNGAIANWMPKTNAKPATPQQIQAKRQAVQKQLKAKGLGADRFYQQVDQAFYQKHPELNNRPLKPGAADSQLRYEWWSIAEEMLKKQ